MQQPGPEANENVDGDSGGVDWPVCENVLRALSEDVRPIGAVAVAVARDDERVAADVISCLAERIAPYESPPADHPAAGVPQADGSQAVGSQADGPPLRSWPRQRSYARPEDAAIVAAAGRAQTRFMAVRSAYADGKYYASDTAHASRTVEELSLWRRWPAAAGPEPLNVNTYTAGTVAYDSDTGACHLRGFADPRRRVSVDCGRLTARLPRHGSAVKMFSELRVPDNGDGGGAPVLVPHHFQVFRPPRDRAVSPPPAT